MLPPKRIILKSNNGGSNSNSSSGSSSSSKGSGSASNNTKSSTELLSQDLMKRNTRTSRSLSPRKNLPRKVVKPSIPESDVSLSLSEVEGEVEDDGNDSDNDNVNDDDNKHDEDGGLLLSSACSISSFDEQKELANNSDSDKEDYGEMVKVPLGKGRLTARQKSLRQTEEAGMESLPPAIDSFFTVPPPRKLTEEEQLKKSEKSRRRATQRDLKLEKSKTDTIKRLLQKQGSRSRKMRQSTFDNNTALPTLSPSSPSPSLDPLTSSNFKNQQPLLGPLSIRYFASKEETILLMGKSVVPLLNQSERPYPQSKSCGVTGCTGPKRYTHSKLEIPICSLDCYRIINNLAT